MDVRSQKLFELFVRFLFYTQPPVLCQEMRAVIHEARNRNLRGSEITSR